MLTFAGDELSQALENGRGTLHGRLEREEIRYDLTLARSLLAGRFNPWDSLREAETKVDRSFGVLIHGTGAPDVPTVRDHQTSHRLFLLTCKLSLICGTVDQFHRRAMFRLIEAKARDAGSYESAYWYCEFLAVLAIYAVRFGYPSAGIRAAAKDSYEYIGRADRWEKLERTLDDSMENPAASKSWALYFWLLTW